MFVVFLLCLYFVLTMLVISEMHSMKQTFLIFPLYKRGSVSNTTFTETVYFNCCNMLRIKKLSLFSQYFSCI